MAFAVTITGIVAVSPWFPLPATLITAFVQPAILASTAAAVVKDAVLAISRPIKLPFSFRIIPLPTCSP